MGKIWEFFENMDEYVYVSDMDTYELIYMNKKARAAYLANPTEALTGKKCYKVLQNSSAPCTICNNQELTPGYFKEWQYFNPIIGKHMVLKNTMVVEDGRRCRIEIALNADTRDWQGNTLRSYQNMETLINEGLRIALRAPAPDQSIEIALEYVGKALNGERTYVFEKKDDGTDDNTYEWAANGVTREKANQRNMPPDFYASWYQNFSENKNIKIEDIESIRGEDPLLYEKLRSQNVHSIVVTPLHDEREVIGFYGIDNPSGISLDYATDMLQIMGHFIVSSLKRRNLVRQLENMSYHDQLTRLGNRHAMHAYMAGIPSNQSIGCVFCDITGLKHINDTEGHSAGDQLILRACEGLTAAFGEYGLFRIGGDELLALCKGIDKDTLYEKIRILKEELPKHSVNMAVGAVWKPDNTISLDNLLTEAEGLMYRDKAAYYRTAGIDRRV